MNKKNVKGFQPFHYFLLVTICHCLHFTQGHILEEASTHKKNIKKIYLERNTQHHTHNRIRVRDLTYKRNQTKSGCNDTRYPLYWSKYCVACICTSVSSPNYKYYKNYTLKKQPTLWFVFFSLCLSIFPLLLLFSCPSPFVITLLEVCVHHSMNAQRYMYKYSFVLLSPIFEYT